MLGQAGNWCHPSESWDPDDIIQVFMQQRLLSTEQALFPQAGEGIQITKGENSCNKNHLNSAVHF